MTKRDSQASAYAAESYGKTYPKRCVSHMDWAAVGNAPVAWAVWHTSEDAPGRIAYAIPIKSLRGTGEARGGEEFIPLYGQPTLTDEEREAITCAADLLIGSKPGATLRKLLERLS